MYLSAARAVRSAKIFGMKPSLTHERLQELFTYDPDRGVFMRRTTRGGYLAGTQAGNLNTIGYVALCVDRVDYLAHRLAWFYMTGEWPDRIDHVNGCRSDNRWANLRNGSQRLNTENLRAARSNSKTGVLGVHPVSGSSSFRARIQVAGEAVYLGCYPTQAEAHAVYLQAKRKLHQGCTI